MNIASSDYYKTGAARRALYILGIYPPNNTENFTEQCWLKMPELSEAVTNLSYEMKIQFFRLYARGIDEVNNTLVMHEQQPISMAVVESEFRDNFLVESETSEPQFKLA